MYPDSVVEHLDIFENSTTRLGAGSKPAVVYQFDLKGMKEAFHHSVAPAVSFAAHGADYSVPSK